VIEVDSLTKRYRSTVAVDDVSFVVHAGSVTGLVGPNGAGKSTLMRMILGLDVPTAGRVIVAGHRYTDLVAPLTVIGALLDAKAVDPARAAANHLRWLAESNGIGRNRVEVVLEVVGLSDVAGKKVGTFSLGMHQRLGVAAALLGDPPILMFDEPINGLDPDGILWIRNLLRSLAAEGRTVFLSSHVMAEMSQTADNLIVMGQGRVIANAPLRDIVAAGRDGVVVRSRRLGDLADALARCGEAALAAGIPLDELTPRHASLEEAFFGLTDDARDFRAIGATTSGGSR
jgi:ABC-2 type transport system ATP-binding protein